MLTSIPMAIAIGAVLGYLAGLGAGGGSLLIIWFTLLLKMPPETARLINLMFFITAAGSACFFRFKKGTLRIMPVLPAIIAGCVASAAMSMVSHSVNSSFIRTAFGILLIFTGIRELFYRPRNDK